MRRPRAAGVGRFLLVSDPRAIALLGVGVLVAVYVGAVWTMVSGGWLYLDDYVKCEMRRDAGIPAVVSHYAGVYSSVYRPLTAGPVVWHGLGCDTPQLITMSAAVMHLASAALLAFIVLRVGARPLAAAVAGVVWLFLPFQGEVLAWPTNSAAYAPVALLTVAALAVVFAGGDPSRAQHRRWVVFAVLSAIAFMLCEQITPSIVVMLLVLALFVKERRRMVSMVSIYAVAPFLTYLVLVAATSRGSSYSRTEMSTDGALNNVWDNVRDGAVFAGVRTMPGAEYWRSFIGTAWHGQWFAFALVGAIVAGGLALVLAAYRAGVPDARLTERSDRLSWGLGIGAFAGLLMSFSLNALEAPLWISPRLFYLPGVLIALALGGAVSGLISLGSRSTARWVALGALGLVGLVSALNVLALQRDGTAYRTNAAMEHRLIESIGARIPSGPGADLVVVGMPWVPVARTVPTVQLGEHVVSSVRVPWALPDAVRWWTGKSLASVAYMEVADYCAQPRGSATVLYYVDGNLVSVPSNLCARSE